MRPPRFLTFLVLNKKLFLQYQLRKVPRRDIMI